MPEHLDIHLPALAGIALALGLWVLLSRALAKRIRSRLRAVPLCLPLLLIPALYGLFWLAFFSSPAMAVQMHAVRLTIQHAIGPFLPWLLGFWLVLGCVPLWPLMRSDR